MYEDDTANVVVPTQQGTPISPTETILPGDGANGPGRELYSALMRGFGEGEQDELEHLMVDNIDRLRESGDGYSP